MKPRWCPGRDSNPHSRKKRILSPASKSQRILIYRDFSTLRLISGAGLYTRSTLIEETTVSHQHIKIDMNIRHPFEEDGMTHTIA